MTTVVSRTHGGSSLLGGGSGSIPGCCGVKNVNLSMRGDGSMSLTATGLENDVLLFIASQLPNGVIISHERQNHLVTITSVDKTVADTYEKIQKGAIFKTVPQSIYKLYSGHLVHKSIVPPTMDPDSSVFIRTSEGMYGEMGWTVQEIIDQLEIPACIPSAFNYHVYEVTVRKGMPIIGLLQSLLPVPGLLIQRLDNIYYIGIPYHAVTVPLGNGICRQTAYSSDYKVYKKTVQGMQGEALYIEDGLNDIIETENLTVQYNLVGEVFGILRSKQSTVNSEVFTSGLI
jgi:hypothetical protein